MSRKKIIIDYFLNVLPYTLEYAVKEWAFNWDNAENGTSKPTPCQYHATMWLRVDPNYPLSTIEKLFDRLDMNLQLLEEGVLVSCKQTKQALWVGCLFSDANVGDYCIFKCVPPEKKGFEKMYSAVKHIKHGFAAVIPHKRVCLMNDGRYRIEAVTGEGPQKLAGIGDNKDDDEEGDSCDSIDLATRFTLFDKEEEVARCHMTYHDDIWDSSTGPTIEKIAVKQSRRGEGLAKVIWYYVLRFIQGNFTLECINKDAPTRNIMVKATKVTVQEVEMRRSKDGESLVSIGYKHLLYDYFGFSVRQPKGLERNDVEAVMYIPLHSDEDFAGKSEKDNIPSPGDPYMQRNRGKIPCTHCGKLGIDHKRCAACKIAAYCDSTCQKLDWKHRHKNWCCKSKEEVEEFMIKTGVMTKDGGLNLDESSKC